MRLIEIEEPEAHNRMIEAARRGGKSKASENFTSLQDDDKRALGIIEIGTRLIEVKASLPHGQWLPWLKHEFGWSSKQAERYVSVASKFDNLSNLNFQPSALYLLAQESTPDAAREEAARRAEDGEQITYTTAQQIIRDSDPRREKEQRKRFVPDDLPDISGRYKLYHSDIADINGKIKKNSIDWIITDPPYGKDALGLEAFDKAVRSQTPTLNDPESTHGPKPGDPSPLAGRERLILFSVNEAEYRLIHETVNSFANYSDRDWRTEFADFCRFSVISSCNWYGRVAEIVGQRHGSMAEEGGGVDLAPEPEAVAS